MFNFKEFCKKGIISAIGQMPDYWVYNNAIGWHEKGVLTEEDLAEVQALIDAKNYVPEDMNIEIPYR